MRRTLSGSLAHLSPPTLLRLLAATRGSGLLRLESAAGTVQMEVAEGRTPPPDGGSRELLGSLLALNEGSYRFEPAEAVVAGLDWVDLAVLVEESRSARQLASPPVVGGVPGFELDAPGAAGGIHVLPHEPPPHPLDDLLAELEADAPEELLLAEVGVVVADPRPWRGALETSWRRRGWRVRLTAVPEGVAVERLDLVVVHHRLSITRVGREADWIGLLERCRDARPPVPVVWVGPLGDPTWVHRLVTAGVAFLLPPPQGESGEVAHRFADMLTRVVDRELRRRGVVRHGEVPGGAAELIDALLHGSDPGQTVGALLQLVSIQLGRAAVLLVEAEAFRCRAGFGFALDPGAALLPRGVGLLERVVRSGDPVLAVDPGAAGARQLARMLGLDRLSPETAILPLGRRGAIEGLLVADRSGQPLPDLTELSLVARRLGGSVVAGLRSE